MNFNVIVKKRNILIVILISFSLILAACNKESSIVNIATSDDIKENNQVTQQTEAKNSDDNQSNKDNNTLSENIITTYEVCEENYIEEKIKISYPQVINYKDINKQGIINDIIKCEALKRTENASWNNDLSVLEIDYNIKLISENILSIQFLGYTNYNRAPYPFRFLFALNINLSRGNVITLSDIINDDNIFVEKYNTGELVPLMPFQKEALDSLPGLDIKREFEAKDFYLTKDSLGISIGVAHAIGDHAEFEIKYQDIADNIKAENEIWKGILN